jgi:uncharacterized protein with NRDE domain
MCLILVAWRVHPDYPIVLAANRDEFRRRPTAAAHWWQDRPLLLAGRDLQAHGTWLGLTREGQLAALTNFRDPQQIKPDAPSRGGLVVQMLESAAPIDERLAQLRAQSARYSGFSLLCTDGAQMGVFESVPATGRLLEPGIYGLSNHLLDTPWPKLVRAKSNLANALQALPDDAALLALLRDDQTVPDEHLPRTGVSLEWERLLSSAFIRGSDYGTRSSNVIRIAVDGQTTFKEWTWQGDGTLESEVSFEFKAERRVPDARAYPPAPAS